MHPFMKEGRIGYPMVHLQISMHSVAEILVTQIILLTLYILPVKKLIA
jgi:hypothetical protein